MNLAHKNIYLGLTSAFLIAGGAFLLIFRFWMYDSLLTFVFTLRPSSPIFELWSKPPKMIITQFYIFNWTNPEDIRNSSVKPRFQQMGPYAFNTKVEKVNITWNANGTVTFRLHQLYYFNEEASGGKLTDRITTLNMVTASAVHKLRHQNYFVKRGFSMSLSLLAPQLHVTKTAGELLFEGYQDPYVDLYTAFQFGGDAPAADRAGILYNRNNSYTIDGVFNVATGEDGGIGRIMNWNYQSKIRRNEGECAELGGSIGDFFQQRRSRSFARMFLSDSCRYYKMDYEDDVLVKNIKGYKYSVDRSALDNGSTVEENACYCQGECLRYGLQNVSSCAQDAPAFISLPHFYKADPWYLDQIEGLEPQKEKHEMFVTLEPRIGFCIEIALRLQINFLLHPVDHVTLFEDVPTIFFPIMWTEQKEAIPDEYTWQLRFFLSIPTVIIPVLSAVMVVVGVCLIFFCKNNYYRNFLKVATTEKCAPENNFIDR